MVSEGIKRGRRKLKPYGSKLSRKTYKSLDLNLSPFSPPTDNDSMELNAQRKKREEGKIMCGGYILNALSDRLDDLYIVEPTGKNMNVGHKRLRLETPYTHFPSHL